MSMRSSMSMLGSMSMWGNMSMRSSMSVLGLMTMLGLMTHPHPAPPAVASVYPRGLPATTESLRPTDIATRCQRPV